MNMKSKIKDYLLFTKVRLTFSVAISAVAGFLLAGGGTGIEFFYLLAGGFFVTSASIGSNQIAERDLDAKMPRTADRPIPSGRMSVLEGVVLVIIFLALGSFLLYQLNFNTMLLGIISFVSYAFIYTPSKRYTPWAVVIGAFPGAIPPMIGAIGAIEGGAFGALPGALFLVQFIWQLPHFWAIAWVSNDDYQKAGFQLLPSKHGKSKIAAFRITFVSLLLIPFSLAPWALELQGANLGMFTVTVASLLGLVFFLYSYKLFLTLDDRDAKRLMFASFIYLPLLQYTYVIDKYFF